MSARDQPRSRAMPAARRTQAERTAATRGALADAATDLLIERGWASVTAIEVCNRAGVTRGAFHHHYGSLPELLADALRRLYATFAPGQRLEVADLPGLIDGTWAIVGQPRFKAVLEAWLAMANDPTLRAEIGPVVLEFASLVHPDGKDSTILVDDAHRSYYLMARETMLGLALGRATNGSQALGHEEAVLEVLRSGAAEVQRAGQARRGSRPSGSMP